MLNKVRIYVTALRALAIGATAAVYRLDPVASLPFVQAAVVFALLSAVCEMLAYKKAARSESGSIAFLPTLAAVIVAPSWVTVLAVALATIVVQVANKRALIKALFNIAQVSLWIAICVLVYRELGGRSLLDRTTSVNLPAFVAILLVFGVLNSAAVAGAIAISEGESFWDLWWGRARVT